MPGTGEIVAGGQVRLHIPRELFYKKELEFAVSRAWGPGMYDPDYEERGLKYPLAYARWTAQRNMEEFLNMVSLGSVKLNGVTTHRFPFEKALEAYQIRSLAVTWTRWGWFCTTIPTLKSRHRK